MLNPVYGTMKVDMIFDINMVKSIKLKVFQINPYYLSIFNRTIEADQMNLVWNVDDMDISHMNSYVVSEIT